MVFTRTRQETLNRHRPPPPLEQVREIFGEHRPFLFAQLQKLIRQACPSLAQHACAPKQRHLRGRLWRTAGGHADLTHFSMRLRISIGASEASRLYESLRAAAPQARAAKRRVSAPFGAVCRRRSGRVRAP